jgi:SH3-like domain-containing protein
MAARGKRRIRWKQVLAVVLPAVCLAPAAPAADTDTKPLPRFGMLRVEPANLRAGPGERYPIEWVLVRKDMPVEIVGEFDQWRRIRDWQGTEGWVHERVVADKRAVIVVGAVRALHRDPDAASPVVARAEAGVIAQLLACQGGWCRIQANDTAGWVQRGEIWGVFTDETVP